MRHGAYDAHHAARTTQGNIERAGAGQCVSAKTGVLLVGESPVGNAFLAHGVDGARLGFGLGNHRLQLPFFVGEPQENVAFKYIRHVLRGDLRQRDFAAVGGELTAHAKQRRGIFLTAAGRNGLQAQS